MRYSSMTVNNIYAVIFWWLNEKDIKIPTTLSPFGLVFVQTKIAVWIVKSTRFAFKACCFSIISLKMLKLNSYVLFYLLRSTKKY